MKPGFDFAGQSGVCLCVRELKLTDIAYIYMYKEVGSGLVDRQSLSCSGSDGTIWGWNGSALVEGKANLVQMGKTPAGVRWSCNLFGQSSVSVCTVDRSLCSTPPEKPFQLRFYFATEALINRLSFVQFALKPFFIVCLQKMFLFLLFFIFK